MDTIEQFHLGARGTYADLTLVLVASCRSGVATRKTNSHPAMAGANVAAS
jgi:hypothetical protein